MVLSESNEGKNFVWDRGACLKNLLVHIRQVRLAFLLSLELATSCSTLFTGCLKGEQSDDMIRFKRIRLTEHTFCTSAFAGTSSSTSSIDSTSDSDSSVSAMTTSPSRFLRRLLGLTARCLGAAERLRTPSRGAREGFLASLTQVSGSAGR